MRELTPEQRRAGWVLINGIPVSPEQDRIACRKIASGIDPSPRKHRDEFAEMRKMAKLIRQARQFRVPQEDIDYLEEKLDRMKAAHAEAIMSQNDAEMRHAG